MFIQLVFNDCFVRASAGASAATNAGIRVDDIDVAFRNSAHGAFVNASAASNAAVCDFVSHNVFNLRVCFEFSFSCRKNTTTFIPMRSKSKFLISLNKNNAQIVDCESVVFLFSKWKIKSGNVWDCTYLLYKFAANLLRDILRLNECCSMFLNSFRINL